MLSSRRSRALVGLGASAVLVTGCLVALASGSRRSAIDQLLSAPDATPVATVGTSAPDLAPTPTPSPSSVPPVLASALPSGGPSAVGVPPAVLPVPSAHGPTASSAATGPVYDAAERHDAALHHTGLPTRCSQAGACSWPDAEGAIPLGPTSITLEPAGAHAVHLRWSNDGQDGGGNMGPVLHYVIRMVSSDFSSWTTLSVLGHDVLSTTEDDLPDGTYDLCSQQLNVSGLSTNACQSVTIGSASASPSPTDSTPSPSPTPS